VRNLYLRFVFAWLTGSGDLHAKNVSVLGNRHGGFTIAPVYDVPCALLYGDDTLALKAAATVDLNALPLEGSPLTHTERELLARRTQLDT
jgi:serine/threonine-protein kinase HipA